MFRIRAYLLSKVSGICQIGVSLVTLYEECQAVHMVRWPSLP